MMNIANVGAMSLGQWSAMARGWAAAHSEGSAPPSDEEFDRAVLAVRGID